MSSGCQGTLLWWWTIWYWLAFKQAFRRALGVKGEGWVVFPNVRELGRRLDICLGYFNIPFLNKKHQIEAWVDKIQ